MLFRIDMHSQMPELVKGDVVEIHGVRFPYVGLVKCMKDAYKTYKMECVVRTEDDGGQYHLIYDKRRKAIYNDAQRNQVTNIASDKSPPVEIEKKKYEPFTLDINPGDNLLKVKVKKAINALALDRSELQKRFRSSNHMSNMVRILTSDTNLSDAKCTEWLDILHCTREQIIRLPDGSILDES